MYWHSYILPITSAELSGNLKVICIGIYLRFGPPQPYLTPSPLKPARGIFGFTLPFLLVEVLFFVAIT